MIVSTAFFCVYCKVHAPLTVMQQCLAGSHWEENMNTLVKNCFEITVLWIMREREREGGVTERQMEEGGGERKRERERERERMVLVWYLRH